MKSIMTIKDISADIPKSLDGATISNPLAIHSIATKTKLNISFSHEHFSNFLKACVHYFLSHFYFFTK